MPAKKSYPTVTDQFCGAGGSSLGAVAVGLEVHLALNHWQLAIETHNTNFPNTLHDCADVSASDPRRYPSTDILIASPECTNHSIAKGAKRRRKQMSLFGEPTIDPSAERSRATMWDVPRFAEYHDYNIIIAENVVDARHWIMWDAWIHAIDSLGYYYHIVYFNSMFSHLDPLSVQDVHDFAPQSRDRMYVVFWKKGNKKPDLDFRPKAFCDHCNTVVNGVQSFKDTQSVKAMGGRWGRYGDQYVYRCPQCAKEVSPFYFAAMNAIDWSLSAERIGDRKRPLKPKTIKRIKKGLEMFAGQQLGFYPYMLDTTFTHADKPPKSSTEPLQTQTARQSTAVVFPQAFLTIQYTPGYNKSFGQPLAGITTQDHHGLVTMPFLLGYANGESPAKDVTEPLRTFHTENGQGVVMPPFMVHLRGTAGGMNRPSGIDDVLGTVSAGGVHHALITPFLMSYYGSNGNHRSVADGMGSLTTKDRHALVTGHTPDVDDCSFRMLQPHEIQRGMAFKDEYVVLGNKREQVKQLGNAVTPPVMKMILERCVETFK